MKVYNWRDEVEKKTIEISSEISRVLHGNWLAGGKLLPLIILFNAFFSDNLFKRIK